MEELSIKAKQVLLEILRKRVGPSQKISREELFDLFLFNMAGRNHSVSDRYMRQMIAELREEPRGCWIVASQDAGGYFWASSLQELDQFTAHDLSRAKTLLKKISTQRKNAGLVISPQIRMEGL
jgi:hypothetical protein